MIYEYRDEPIPEKSELSETEIKRRIAELEIKNYGHTLPNIIEVGPQRATTYSIKRKCSIYQDTGEKVAL